MAVKQTLCCDRCGRTIEDTPPSPSNDPSYLLATCAGHKVEYRDLCPGCVKTIQRAIATMGPVDRSKKKAVKGKP